MIRDSEQREKMRLYAVKFLLCRRLCAIPIALCKCLYLRCGELCTVCRLSLRQRSAAQSMAAAASPAIIIRLIVPLLSKKDFS